MTSFRINNGQRGLTLLSAFFLTLLTVFFSQTSLALSSDFEESWETISTATVEQSSRFYDRSKREYYTINTAKNVSDSDLQGSIRVLVTSNSHPITNADGTDNNQPYFNVQGLESFRINFQRIRASFAYTAVVQRLVQDSLDSDGDGIPDSEDNCPNDPTNTDPDGDGICGTEDLCPNDASNTDPDGDGICGTEDLCPNDSTNTDPDGDGICGTEDLCPNDATNTDPDEDGICGTDDLCPNDPLNNCNTSMTITGQVFSEGSSVANASITIGSNSVTTVTDIAGSFTAEATANDLSNDGLNDFFPIKINAPGYATSNAKVTFKAGKSSYKVSIEIKPISDTITAEDDLSQGVEIIKEGNPVGQLMIPTSALPSGVTEVTGTITYLDPTTDDILSTPGGDLLALPEGSDPSTDSPVPLESYGMMEFDLKDQNGNEIHELADNAEVCMQAISGLGLGDTVPLWYYDETKGLWIEQGQGQVVTRNDQLMICGNVTHFTWWNYDQPIESHSCFKFQFIFETNNSDLSGLEWNSEGVTYNGTSPNRDCNRDSNDPGTGSSIDSFTVKRTTVAANPEQIRVFAIIGGAKFYLLRDGDGTYSLTQDQDTATIFDSPEANGSCINNINVDQCQFLDYLDSNPDGILPLATDINLPPLISEFSVDQTSLTPGEGTSISAVVTDPEGTNVSLDWSTECGYYYSTTSNGFISPTNDSGVSGTVFNANYTSPSTLDYPFESCRITLTATDSDGVTSSADKWIHVIGSSSFTFEGILYGTDGQPMADTEINYFSGICNSTDYPFITTDFDGYYSFNIDLTNCGDTEIDGFIDLGSLSVNYVYSDLNWTHDEYIDIDIQTNTNCYQDQGSDTFCELNMYLPTLWGALSGNIYQSDVGDYTNMHLSSYSGNGSDSTNFTIDSNASSFGPFFVPLGQGSVQLYSNNFSNYWGTSYSVPSIDGVTQDAGIATAPVTVTVYNDQGIPLAGVETTITSYSYSTGNTGVTEYTGITDNTGQYTEPAVPLGYVIAKTSLPTYSVTSNVRVKDQQVTIDLNSTDICTVTGTLFDQFGEPVSEGSTFQILAQNSTTGSSFIDVTTNALGAFSVTSIHPGYVFFYGNNFNSYNNFHYIDNCRTTDGSPRIIRMDGSNYGQ